MGEKNIDTLDFEVENLIKYKNIFDESSMFTSIGIYGTILGFLLWLFGGLIFGGNFGAFLNDVGPIIAVLGMFMLVIAFPIKTINKPKYQSFVGKTQLDSINTPETTKMALSSYLRNQRYGKKTGRISCAIELIADVNGDKAMDAVMGILEDHHYDEQVRAAAIRHMNEFVSENEDLLLDTLYKVYTTESSPEIRIAAVTALGYVKNLRSVNILKEAKWDENKKVRKSVKEALKKLKDAGIY